MSTSKKGRTFDQVVNLRGHCTVPGCEGKGDGDVMIVLRKNGEPSPETGRRNRKSVSSKARTMCEHHAVEMFEALASDLNQGR